jgi:hypothetical protein
MRPRRTPPRPDHSSVHVWLVLMKAFHALSAHAAAMEEAVSVLSRTERLTLLRLLKKLGKHAAETRQ